MSVQCAICDTVIDTPPKMPLRVTTEDGHPVIQTDYSSVYEHVRDTHPDQWTKALAEEFDTYRARPA